jgi:hypothetical protein
MGRIHGSRQAGQTDRLQTQDQNENKT